MRSDIFFGLKTNWRRVGVRRQKKPSLRVEDSKRLSFGFEAADNCKTEEKGSGTEDGGSDLDFSECERMDELDQTKVETLA